MVPAALDEVIVPLLVTVILLFVTCIFLLLANMTLEATEKLVPDGGNKIAFPPFKFIVAVPAPAVLAKARAPAVFGEILIVPPPVVIEAVLLSVPVTVSPLPFADCINIAIPAALDRLIALLEPIFRAALVKVVCPVAFMVMVLLSAMVKDPPTNGLTEGVIETVVPEFIVKDSLKLIAEGPTV